MKRSALWLLGQVLCRMFTTLWFDLKVYGLEHVPKTGGLLLVANHQSYLDPVLVSVRLDRPVGFFAKSELFENPYMGWLIRSLHAFPVRRGKGDRAALQAAVEKLKQGAVVNVYPEGTRTEDGEIREILPGVALIVKRSGVPMVPVVVHGSFQSWPKGSKLFHPHPIKVMYGPPMDVRELKGEEIVALIRRTLQNMLAELRAIDK
jgi:1-acyl-sn-glycerol-3-phosphate acyltransferase